MTPAGEGGAGVDVHLNRAGGEDGADALPADPATLERAVRLALESADRPLRGEVSVTFLPADEMASLNREYLDREGPTDVVAFELGGGDALLGDVYVCPEVADRAADREGIDPREETVRLVVHGVLHVLGHDHPEDDRWSSPMYRLQERLVDRALSSREPGA